MVVYSTCIAIKLHFDRGTYDAFKFNFKGPSKRNSAFLKSNDRYVYEKIARKYHDINELIGFILANVLEGNTWVRKMDDETYMMWVAKMQRMQYQFNSDMTILFDHAVNHELTFDECLKNRNGSVPILDLLRRKRITSESVIIVDELVGFLSSINKITMSDPLNLLSDIAYMLSRYKPFIAGRINKAAAKNIIINLFTEVNN